MFSSCIYNAEASVVTDNNRLIRMDDWELREDVQAELKPLLEKVSPENFAALGDYEGYKSEFLNLNGFGLEGINYQAEIDLGILSELKP